MQKKQRMHRIHLLTDILEIEQLHSLFKRNFYPVGNSKLNISLNNHSLFHGFI